MHCNIGEGKKTVGRWKQKRQRCIPTSCSTALPYEIIEEILSRLPVKDLLRFKLVSKQWEATITDPMFAEIHLRQFKNSSSRNLLAWEDLTVYNGFHIIKLQNKNNGFELVSEIKHSGKYCFDGGILCSCDGLYLKRCEPQEGKASQYVLCNPSCKAYREFYCPQQIDDRCAKTVHGIYYNSLMKDYKIVIADAKHYAVFSCRYKKWSDLKEMKEDFFRDLSCCEGLGISLNGSCFWAAFARRKSDPNYGLREEIICFDGRDEDFKKLPLPDYKKPDVEASYLTSFGGHLWLFIDKMGVERIEGSMHFYKRFRILKKVSGDDDGKDQWVKFNECNYHSKFESGFPLVCGDEVILEIGLQPRYILCQMSRNTFTVIDKYRPDPVRSYRQPIPHVENLFLV